MDKDIFSTIRRALHPDSRNSISDKKLAEAFRAFMGLEKTFSMRRFPDQVCVPRRQRDTKQPGGVRQEASRCQEGKTDLRPIGSSPTLR